MLVQIAEKIIAPFLLRALARWRHKSALAASASASAPSAAGGGDCDGDGGTARTPLRKSSSGGGTKNLSVRSKRVRTVLRAGSWNSKRGESKRGSSGSSVYAAHSLGHSCSTVADATQISNGAVVVSHSTGDETEAV